MPSMELVEQGAKSCLGVQAAVLLTRAHPHIEHQPEVAHPVGVQRMAGTPWLVGVVAQGGPFLVAEQSLDGGINIQYPGAVQDITHTAHQCGAQPLAALLLVHAREAAAHGIFADDPAHAQRLCRYRVAAQCGDVGVAFVPGKDRQQQCSQHVSLGRGIGAGIGQGQSSTQCSKMPAVAKNSAKNTSWPLGVASRAFVPAHMHAPTQCVYRHGRLRREGHFSLAF